MRVLLLLMLALVSGGCGGGPSSDVERILDEVLGAPWHLWAQIEDMDGDGTADIVTAGHILDNNRAELNVFVQQPGGTYFKQQVLLGTRETDRVSHLLVADLNLDGLPDAVVSHIGFTAAGSTPGRTIRVLLKTGAGAVQFAAADQYSVGENPVFAASGDVDLDGLPDLLVATRDGVSLLLQDGGNQGSFLPPRPIGGGPARGVVVADVDQDGLQDLLIAESNSVRLYLNDAADVAGFRNSSTWPAADWICGLTAGDFNADGWLDYATCHSDLGVQGVSGVAWRTQDPLAPGTFSDEMLATHAEGASLSSIDSADLNGDGRDDLVVAVMDGLDGVSIGVHLAQNDGTFSAASFFRDNQITGPWSATIGQLGPDDAYDVVLAHGEGVFVHRGNGDGTFATAQKVGE